MSRWIAGRLALVRASARERGQGTIEYLGIVVVIAVIIGVLAGTTSIGDAILTGILNKISQIVGAG
jgi:hypothetical protein